MEWLSWRKRKNMVGVKKIMDKIELFLNKGLPFHPSFTFGPLILNFLQTTKILICKIKNELHAKFFSWIKYEIKQQKKIKINYQSTKCETIKSKNSNEGHNSVRACKIN